MGKKFLYSLFFLLLALGTSESVFATNYFKLQVKAVYTGGASGAHLYAGLWSGWQSNFPAAADRPLDEFTTGVLSSSGNPDVEIVTSKVDGMDFLGWYRDECCTDLISTEFERNVYGSSSGIAFSTDESKAPTTTFYAKFSQTTVSWSTLGVVPTAGKYYLYNVGGGGLLGWYSSTSSSLSVTKDPNKALLFTLEDGVTTTFSAVRNDETLYLNEYGTGMVSTTTPIAKSIEADNGFFYIKLNSGSNYWETSTSGSCTYAAKSGTKLYQRWIFIPEDAYNACVRVEALNENGSVTITESPTASGTAYVTFDVSEVGPTSAFTYSLSGGDGHWALGTPVRCNYTVIVPVIYTAQNLHSTTLVPASTVTVTMSSTKASDASLHTSASGYATSYVDLQPRFEMAVSELDWSYEEEALVETYYAGMEVAASQRERLANKLIYDAEQTNTIAKNNATWTATIIGDDAAQFKFANGTQSASGPYTPELLDVIFAPTATGDFTATLHIEVSYKDANNNNLVASHDVALSGKGLFASYATFAANGNEQASAEESYDFGNIIGTNHKDVTAELNMTGLTGVTETWSDPDGVFEFDESTIDLTESHQVLSFRAHRSTPIAAEADHTATLTISGTGTEGPVTAVLTLTYHALPLTVPTVTWNWAALYEDAVATNPIATNSDGEWTLTMTAGDVVTYNAENHTASVPYLHHEPGHTASFTLTIPQTDTYAAVNTDYASTVVPTNPDVLIDSQAKFDQYVSYKSSNNTNWLRFTEEDHSVYLWTETVGFATHGHTKLSFDFKNQSSYNLQITEYFADGTSRTINNSRVADGFYEFDLSPQAVEVRLYTYGTFYNIHYYEQDYIATELDQVVLVNDNGTINSLDLNVTFAGKQGAVVSLNEAAQPYFELQAEGKPTGSSLTFTDADGLALYHLQDVVITVAPKAGINTAAASAAAANGACQILLADTYTYNSEQKSLPIVLMDAYDVTFPHLNGGTYTVTYTSDTEHPHAISTTDFVQHMTSVNPGLCEITLSEPAPAEGYLFQGWKVNDDFVSFLSSCTIIVDHEATVQPVFAEIEGTYRLEDAYFDDFNQATTHAVLACVSTPIVLVNKDAVLTPGNYTIPAGVTLLIPHKDNFYKVQTGPDAIETNSDALEAAAKQITIYRMLTLQEGATIACDGTICIAGHVASANGGRKTCYVAKACGVLNMANGGHIDLNDGAVLYAWGFVKGQDMDQGNNTQNVGSITAHPGATAWEDFEMGDWRGGTAASTIAGESDKMLFPFQSYSFQNIEVPITYTFGSSLMAHANLMALSSSWPLNVAIIGSDGNLFLLQDEQSTIRKWYDPTTDLICIELGGSAQLDALLISFLGIYSFNSADFNLPISNSMHIILKDCNMTLAKPLTIQAGAVMEIKESATVNLEAPVHLYDVDEWGQYIYKNSCFRTFNTISMHKDRGAESSKEGLDDAKLIVDGTLNVVKNKGYLYATTGGANIMGNGGGKVIFGGGMPSAGTLWHVTGLSDFGSSNENAANLCNDDGSYTQSTASTTYYNVNGRWFYEEFKDEKPDHTYDFYYLDNGNAGEETWSPAVYSHDKTGLTARMKWFNVTPNEDCPKFNPDPEADLESEWWIGTNPAALYNYNMLGEWHQFIATEQTGVYSGSDNTLYQKDECVWVESGTVDENCLYTFYEGGLPVKKALVDGHFVPLISNGYDPAYHNNDESKYYICFQGCNWHEATPYEGEYKAYTIAEGGDYIWFNNDWLNVEREELYFYTADEVTNVRTYYEYVDGEWLVATPYVSVTDAVETRTFFSFQQALKVASTKNDATITILRDFTEATHSSRTPMEFTKHNTTCTLDLNGHIAEINVEGSSATAVKMIALNGEGSTFIITDNSEHRLGELRLKANVTSGAKATRWYGIYVQQGELIMNAGKVYAENMFTYTSTSNSGVVSAIAVAGGKNFTFNNGEIEAKAPYAPYGVHMEGSTVTTGKTYINDGTITATSTSVTNTIGLYIGSGTAYVSGGTINALTKTTTSRGIYVEGSASNYIGHLEMTGGTVNATATTTTAYGIYVGGAYTFNNVKPNTIKATYRGVANISGGTVNAVTNGTTTAYSVITLGTTTITGGAFNATPKTTTAYGLLAQDGTVTISGDAVFTVRGTDKVYGVYANGATPSDKTGRPFKPVVTINGGTFNVTIPSGAKNPYGINVDKNTRAITSTSSGYYAGNYASEGTVIVNDGVFNVTSPGGTAYNVVVAAAVTQSGATGYDAVTATPKCTINGGKFVATGKKVAQSYPVNASAAPENLVVNGGYFSNNLNLSTYAAAPNQVITLPKTDPNYPTYKYKVAEAYTITFMNGETSLQATNQKAGTVTTYDGAEPTKDDTNDPKTKSYIFDGWATEADGEVVYAKGAALPEVTADATYYAHFEETTYKWRISFNSNGGIEGVQHVYVENNKKLSTAISALPTATRTNYTLAGWYTKASGGSAISLNAKATADKTYYAHWTADKYNLTWNLVGGVVTKAGTAADSAATGSPTAEVAFAAAITAPVVAKTGYTFVNWGVPTVAVTMPNEALTYTAVWAPATNTAYVVKHYLQNMDGTYPEEPADIDELTGTTEAYVTPNTKSYPGYVTPTKQTVQILADGSLEVIYHYDLISYTVTFDAATNGGICAEASQTVKHGATLTLPEATQEGYTFDGWFTKPVGGDPVTNETVIQRNIGTLYAQFTEAITESTDIIAGKSSDAEAVDIVLTDPGIEAHSLIIEKDGRVNIIPGASVTVEDFILESNGTTSGQLLGTSIERLTVSQHVYFDLTLNTQLRHWYAVAVPWEVDVVNGIYLKNGRHLILGRDFDLVYYQGNVRASEGAGYQCWKYAEDVDGDKTMHPGRAYMMYFGGEWETIRFESKHLNIAADPVAEIGTYPQTTGKEGDANWNGIANPKAFHAHLAAGGATYGYYLNNGNLDEYLVGAGEPTYKLVNLASYTAIVGKPLFIQATDTEPIVAMATIAASAPRRRQAAERQEIQSVYEISFGAIGNANKDNIFIQTAEEKENRYVVGMDLVKAGINAQLPQIWINRYDTRLGVNTSADQTWPLTLNVPKEGDYKISIVQSSMSNEEDDLYLTYNGAIIWNLSDGAYKGWLDKGTWTEYGLTTGAQSPQITTEIDKAVVDAKGETRKVLIDDHVYIIRGNKVYTVDGQLVK